LDKSEFERIGHLYLLWSVYRENPKAPLRKIANKAGLDYSYAKHLVYSHIGVVENEHIILDPEVKKRDCPLI
jgi:hypothetical protein